MQRCQCYTYVSDPPLPAAFPHHTMIAAAHTPHPERMTPKKAGKPCALAGFLEHKEWPTVMRSMSLTNRYHKACLGRSLRDGLHCLVGGLQDLLDIAYSRRHLLSVGHECGQNVLRHFLRRPATTIATRTTFHPRAKYSCCFQRSR